jgi:L-cystine transport system substrate-binding protein
MSKLLVKLAPVIVASLFVVSGCGAQTASNNSGGSGTSANSSNASTNGNSSTPATSTSTSELDKIKQAGVMKIGIEGTYPPYDYLGSNNQYTGFDVELATDLAKSIGVKTEFVATQWDGLIGGLKADKFDAIAADMSITPQRAQQVDFTNPYLISGAVIVTKKGSPEIHSLAGLKGKNVGVGAGTTFATLAQQSGANVHLYKTANDYIQDLLNGRLDAIINDQNTMAYMISKKHMPLVIDTSLLDRDNIGMAIKKGNEDLVTAMNNALSQMVADGEYDKLYEKYFHVKPPVEPK